MKKIITLLSLGLLLMSFQCESEKAVETDCDCVEVRYTLSPGDNTYQYHSTVPRTDLDCEDETSTIAYDGMYHTQIKCN